MALVIDKHLKAIAEEINRRMMNSVETRRKAGQDIDDDSIHRVDEKEAFARFEGLMKRDLSRPAGVTLDELISDAQLHFGKVPTTVVFNTEDEPTTDKAVIERRRKDKEEKQKKHTEKYSAEIALFREIVTDYLYDGGKNELKKDANGFPIAIGTVIIIDPKTNHMKYR